MCWDWYGNPEINLELLRRGKWVIRNPEVEKLLEAAPDWELKFQPEGKGKGPIWFISEKYGTWFRFDQMQNNCGGLTISNIAVAGNPAYSGARPDLIDFISRNVCSVLGDSAVFGAFEPIHGDVLDQYGWDTRMKAPKMHGVKGHMTYAVVTLPLDQIYQHR